MCWDTLTLGAYDKPRYLLPQIPQNTMKSDETVITQKLPLSGEEAKRLSTHTAEMPPEHFGNFTMDFLSGLDCFGLFHIQSTEQPIQLTPGNCLGFGTFP